MQELKMPEAIQERKFEFTDSKKGSGFIANLLERFDEENIRYCHWKSNWAIEKWLTGKGDLDLLVKRKDVDRFTAVLCEFGFKQATVPPEKEVPGILNFYAFDPESQEFIHVHAHYQLVFGHDLTKNYRLPVEDAFINEAVHENGIFIASPEMELIFFSIRMLLKFSITESLLRTLLGKSEKQKKEIYREISYLESKVDDVRLDHVLERHFPMFDRTFLEECVASLGQRTGIWKRNAAKRKLLKRLSGYTRTPVMVENVTRIKRGFIHLSRKVFKLRMPGKKLENGGLLIAIVGGDGAGKTTCVDDIYGWLSGKFETEKVHLGKPPKSVSTILAGGLLKAGNKVFGHDSSSITSFLRHFRWLCTARDRYKLYKKIRRLASNGKIVICDRYPVPELALMDSPKVPAETGGSLSKIERRYYRQIAPPEEMFVLRVAPDTAVQRKTDEPRDHVFTRSSELWDFDWRNSGANLIDAGRPLANVLADLKTAIWASL